jgi:hypothetical protein
MIKTIVLCVALAVGFVSGFAYSTRSHGDWIVMRHGQQCAAFDPALGRDAGYWQPRANGRCRLSDFLWREAFGL